MVPCKCVADLCVAEGAGIEIKIPGVAVNGLCLVGVEESKRLAAEVRVLQAIPHSRNTGVRESATGIRLAENVKREAGAP